MSGSVEVAWWASVTLWVAVALLIVASSLIIYATLRDLGIFRLPPKTPEWPKRVYDSLEDSSEELDTGNVRVIEHFAIPPEPPETTTP